MAEELARLFKILGARLLSKWFTSHASETMQQRFEAFTWLVLLGLGVTWIISIASAVVRSRNDRLAVASLAGDFKERARTAALVVVRSVIPILPVTPIALLVVAAVGRWPYSYYVLMRIVVFFSGAFGCLALRETKHYKPWVWVLVVVCLLYNPYIPIHLSRTIWVVMNLLTAAIFAIVYTILRMSWPVRET